MTKKVTTSKKPQFKPGLPEDLQVALETFFQAVNQMEEFKLDSINSEYFGNLLDVLQKYPQYNDITRSVMQTYIDGVKE